MLKFVSDLWQVGGFLRVSPVSSSNKTDRHDITEILLKITFKILNDTIDFNKHVHDINVFINDKSRNQFVDCKFSDGSM